LATLAERKEWRKMEKREAGRQIQLVWQRLLQGIQNGKRNQL